VIQETKGFLLLSGNRKFQARTGYAWIVTPAGSRRYGLARYRLAEGLLMRIGWGVQTVGVAGAAAADRYRATSILVGRSFGGSITRAPRPALGCRCGRAN
jgi:hypothetical protein